MLLGILFASGLIGFAGASQGIGGWNATTPVTFGPYICVNYTTTLFCSDSLHWYSTTLSSTGISPWKQINSTFPQTLQGCNGQGLYNGYFYCFSHTIARNPVAYYAKINSTALGNWTEISVPSSFGASLGTGRYACAFYSAGGEFVYCTAENVNSKASYYARVNSTGGIGSWNASTPVGVTDLGYPSSFGQYFGVIGENTLYYGISGTSNINFVNLTSTGALTGYGSTTSFPNSNVDCSYYNGYMYCVDSSNNTEYVSPVTAPVGFGPFNKTTPFPSGITPFVGAEDAAPQWGIIVNNYIYDLVLSGDSYYAKIVNSSPIPPPSVSVSPTSQSEDTGQPVTITATVTNPGSGGDTVSWYNDSSGTPVLTAQGGTTFPIASLPQGTYSYYAEVTDSNGGTGRSNTATVSVNASIQAKCNYSDDDYGIHIAGNGITKEISVTNQSYVTVTGNSNNVAISIENSCPVYVKVAGGSNKLTIANGTIFLDEAGNSNNVTMHGVSVKGQKIVGSDNYVYNVDLVGNSLTVSGNNEHINNVIVRNASQIQIIGNSNVANLTLESNKTADLSIMGKSNIVVIHNGSAAIEINGNSNIVNLYDAAVQSRKITGNNNEINTSSITLPALPRNNGNEYGNGTENGNSSRGHGEGQKWNNYWQFWRNKTGIQWGESIWPSTFN